MITKKIKNSLVACLVGCGCVAAVSCTEFDDYNKEVADATASANQTLWENIQQNPQLSDFASLVKKADFDIPIDEELRIERKRRAE